MTALVVISLTVAALSLLASAVAVYYAFHARLERFTLLAVVGQTMMEIRQPRESDGIPVYDRMIRRIGVIQRITRLYYLSGLKAPPAASIERIVDKVLQ